MRVITLWNFSLKAIMYSFKNELWSDAIIGEGAVTHVSVMARRLNGVLHLANCLYSTNFELHSLAMCFPISLSCLDFFLRKWTSLPITMSLFSNICSLNCSSNYSMSKLCPDWASLITAGGNQLVYHKWTINPVYRCRLQTFFFGNKNRLSLLK